MEKEYTGVQIFAYKLTPIFMGYMIAMTGGKLLGHVNATWTMIFSPFIAIIALFLFFVVSVTTAAMLGAIIEIIKGK